MATRIITPVFRLSFPNVFTPKSILGGEPKYSLTAVWRPEDFGELDQQKWREMLVAINAECRFRFKKDLKQLAALNKGGANYRLVPRDGAAKELNGFGPGTYFASLNSKQPPDIIDAQRKPIYEADGAIYPGCYCRASVGIYTFNNAGKGVAMGLNNLQKITDGDRLDSATDAKDDFTDAIDERYLDTSLLDTPPAAAAAAAVVAAEAQSDMAAALDDDIPF